MLKTILILIVFIIFIIFVAFAFSLFFNPEQQIRYETCVLLQDQKSGSVDCYGCANGICKDAPLGWTEYEKNTIGIPYSCYETVNGCQLAQ